MITLQLEIDISEDRRLTIQLPENCQTGKHQVVVVLNPEDTSAPTLEGNPLNALARKIQSFAGGGFSITVQPDLILIAIALSLQCQTHVKSKLTVASPSAVRIGLACF